MPRIRTSLLSGITSAPTSGTQQITDETPRTYQAIVTGTGAVTATVIIEGSNDSQATEANVQWVTLGTITLSGTTTDTDGFGSVLPWLLTRARLTAISGTGATVNAFIGA